MSRKQRKAASNPPSEPFTTHEIPLAQPDRSGPQTPTLFDLAAQREAELHAQIPAHRAQTSQTQQDGTSADLATEALITSLIYGLTLTTVHITLDILTWHQYAQEPSYLHLVKRNLKSTLPLSILLVYIFHARFFGLTRFEWLRRVLFFAAAVGCGIYAVYLCNEGAFLAVMKRVPPVVTMALWAVLEMGPGEGVGAVGVVGAVVWWRGWSVL